MNYFRTFNKAQRTTAQAALQTLDAADYYNHGTTRNSGPQRITLQFDTTEALNIFLAEYDAQGGQRNAQNIK